MTPGKARDDLAALAQRLKEIEADMYKATAANNAWLSVRLEVSEALDDLERAVELLDEQYKQLM